MIDFAHLRLTIPVANVSFDLTRCLFDRVQLD